MQLGFLDLASPEFSTRSQAVRDARAANWCARTPYGLAVLRHREVGLLLRDRRLRQGSHSWPDTNGLEGSFAEFWKRSVIGQEGELHKSLRRVVTTALASDFIATLKPDFDRIADELAAPLAQRERFDFMQAFSEPFAGKAICLLLGLDLNDWAKVSYDASDLGLAMGVECKSHENTFNAAHRRLADLSDELVARSRAGCHPEGFIGRLVRAFDEDGTLDDPQFLQDLVVICIFGGVDTTKSQLGFVMSQFAAAPDQWKLLQQDLTLVGNVVEESIRARPTTTWATREALEDFEFGGQVIKKGEILHMLVHASARDPLVCDTPDFDITAKRKIHFGFGGGAHHCLGHEVARTDMASAIAALARHLPSFTYDAEPSFLPDSGNTSPVALPLRFLD